jgi:hypothetical protein
VKLGKLGTVVTHAFDEFITTSGGTVSGALSVTDLSAGDLVVTGAASFTNGLSGDLTGNVTGNATTATTATTATKVQGNLKIQLNSGTTEGTNQFTYNGETGKTVNITKGGIGLGNVENTALSTWAGSANLTTTKVGTLAVAATKGVDTSISSGSSSGNVPTTAAVASFVEGKGYVTSSGVTSVRVQATSPVVSSTNTAQTSTLNTTISLADAYGDTKNPYGTKTPNYVLAGPSSGTTNAAPSFRALVAADIPSLTKSKISDFPTTWALSSVSGADDLKAIEALIGTSGFLKKTAANTWTLDTNTYVTSSGVTSITLSAGEGISLNATGAITTTGTRTITNSGVRAVTESTTNGSISVNTNGTTADVAVHGLGALAYKDSLAKGDVGLGSVTNNRQVKGLPSNTTEGHFVLWGTDGYTVVDGGIGKGDVVAGVQISGSKLTITKADGTSSESDVTIIASQASGATILTDANSTGLSVGDASHPTYFASGIPVQGNVIPTITLNGTANTSPSFFAPTAKGSSGQILKSNGNNTVSWMNQSDLSVGSATSATTATKFSSSRTVALTGDVTGSASGDGSSGWSIATTVGDNSHNHNMTTIVPIATKTYTGWLGTVDNTAASDSFYFLKLRPSNWNCQWKFRYRITATVSASTNYYATSDVTYYGYGQASAPAYAIYNTFYSTSYRPYYYHNFYRLTSTGYSANLYNAIGLGLRSSNGRNTSGYERDISVEILEAKDCTFEFLDTAVKWADWVSNTSTNYAGLTEYDGYTNGLRETGDDNDIATQQSTYTHLTAGAGGMKQYSIVMEDADGTWQSFTTTSGTGNTKTKNTAGFKLGRMYYLSTSSNFAAGSANGNSIVRERNSTIDIRYSTNCGQTLSANQPMWIVGTMNNGLFYLDTTWWTQTAPTTNDGKVYIPLGVVYNSTATSTSAYQIDFMGWQGAYYHDGTNFIRYSEAAKAVKDGSGNNIENTYATQSKALQLYTRTDIGTSPNYDNPGVNGLFELRSSAEATGESGTKPFNGFAPFFTAKAQNVMLQFAGKNSEGLYWRGHQAPNVTLSGVSWLKILDSSNFNSYAPTLTGTGASGSWNITAATATKLSDTYGTLSEPVYINDGVPTKITYLNTHPENMGIIVPFINNDLAHLVQRSGSYEIYSTTATTFTALSINKTALSIDLTNAFDGSNSYAVLNRPQSETTVIDIVCPQTYSYTTRLYVDFGATSWRAKNIQAFVYNSSTETVYVSKGSITNLTIGQWVCNVVHTSTNSSGSTVQGFDRLRLVFSGWANTQNRIAQIGIINYSSLGLRFTYMSRGINDPVYRSIDPAKNDTYNLGSSSYKWSNVYATTFNGNATSATNAEFLTHKTVNNTSLHNTAGTFAFSGSGDPWSGTDWVGLQVGDSADKFQITANGNAMLFR